MESETEAIVETIVNQPLALAYMFTFGFDILTLINIRSGQNYAQAITNAADSHNINRLTEIEA